MISVTLRPTRVLPVFLFCLLLPAAVLAGAAPLHHALEVRLDPLTHEIAVSDQLTLPDELLAEGADGIRFALHGDLTLTETAIPGYRFEALPDRPDLTHYGINEDGTGEVLVDLREYRVIPDPVEGASGPALIISYHGTIHHPLVEEGEAYTRNFSRTPGIIGDEGVVLSGSSWWLPTFGERLVTFTLAVNLPEDWDAVSQGARTRHEIIDGRRQVDWDSPQPMDEVYLIAAQFTEYSRPAGDVTAYAFLREPDPNLAAKYLEATAQYIEMYRKLIGLYPYGKFALVENFWDTGYGMPSFTLLGPRIIRFPFILHSSYPHEILHNWWGNSVFVDYASGNWCEGMTAYLADHLVREGQGRGVDYRRDTLKKYSSFVRGEADFPLTAFRSRHSSATEAVGYGKSLMLWHMLRRQLGDEDFALGLRRFYLRNRSKRASFTDIERVFSEVAGEDLQPFFKQWVERTGAPQLQLGEVSVTPTDTGESVLTVNLRQVQAGAPFTLSVPVAVTLPDEAEARIFSLDMHEAEGRLQIPLPAAPLRIDVDPQFDLFRRLDPLEVPPSLGMLFGADRVTLVLPREDSHVAVTEWETFAKGWAEDDTGKLTIVFEDEIERLPADSAVWVLGSENRWATAINNGESELATEDHCFAIAVRHPDDDNLAIGWIGADRADALAGLARKLPHYGKYSYLAFAGAEPTNDAKGQWPVRDSPLVHFLTESTTPPPVLPAREPLARLEPVFDPEHLSAHLEALTAEQNEGRGVGSEGLELATAYVAEQFKQAGLAGGGDAGSYFQSWEEADGPDGAPVSLQNVIGVLPGTNTDWRAQSVILGAHLDHLGFGWPDVHAGDEGKIHPGADDNASGIAVLLELATLLGAQLEPERTIIFVAFSGEEWDLRGSRHYVENMQRWPVSSAMAMINLDTIGRLNDRKLTIFGTGSATEWVHIVRGIGFTTGVEAKSVADDLGGSDQKSFLDAGLPAIQLFSGGHEDYHRPADTVDKIDITGMIKAAIFARETIVYLSDREDPLTSTLSTGDAAPQRSPAPTGGRKVSLGTMPDFGFPGPGVKVDSVREGSAADQAGLLAGDKIVAIDGVALTDLRSYSDILKKHSPGDQIQVLVDRDGDALTLDVTLEAR
jgi:aminopeptidase N